MGNKALTKREAEEGLSLNVDPTNVVKRLSPTDLDALIGEGCEFESFIKLKDPGDYLRGKFIGAGVEVEVETPATGEIRPLGTWRIEVRPGMVVRLLGSHQLDVEFKNAIAKGMQGREVVVIFAGKVETRKGNHVADYKVAWPRAAA